MFKTCSQIPPAARLSLPHAATRPLLITVPIGTALPVTGCPDTTTGCIAVDAIGFSFGALSPPFLLLQ